jgi:CCR4-NOT transcription complex subunit 1
VTAEEKLAMSLSLRCFAYSQISFLVANTNKKNYKANYSEISKLVSLYGPEASKHLFRCLVSSLDMSSDGRSYGKDGQQLQMLCQEANSLVSKPNFVSLLCYGFEKQENKVLQPSPQLLPQVAKVLKLGRVQEVVFALGLSSSSDSALSYHASQHLKSKLPDLVRSYSDMTSSLEGGLGDVAIEVLHRLLSHLLLSPEDEVGVARESIDAFVQTLRRDFPRERVPVVLSPLIYREQEDITEDRLVPVSVSLASSVFSIELAEIIKDIGYAAAASKQDMIEILKDYGKQNVTIKSVARVLGMMATSLTGLPESVPFMGVTGEAAHASIKGPATWDVKNFVSAVQSLVPNMPWRELILHLDYPGFILPSPEALSLIMTAYNMACREPFPLECVHLAWSNPRGQLSWYLQVLAGCPEFNVSQYMGESIDLEPFKIVLSSEEAKPWQFLCLTRALLHLSEQTHYSEVMTLMATPLKHCPEVLFLAIIECVGHVKLHWNVLQKELICQILPHIISTYPAHCTVLQYAWHGQNVSNQIHCLMVGAMAEWYMQGDLPDPSKMSRILDVTQDTKSMSVVLNVSHFPFVIEVACWATKREYLKLDKWVTDKVKEHHEMFIAECVHFLTTRAPKPVSSAVGSGSERTGLTHEIVLTILACLNLFMGNVRPELAETLRGLIALHGPLPPKPLPTTLTMSGHVHPLEMTGLGGLTGPGGMAGGLMTPSFPGGAALGGPPTPSSPVGGKTGLPGSATGLAGLSQIQQHVREDRLQ